MNYSAPRLSFLQTPPCSRLCEAGHTPPVDKSIWLIASGVQLLLMTTAGGAYR